MQVEKLEDPAAAKRFYETRYEQGYMDVWGDDRRRRLRDVLAKVELPAGARVLDFGCGSGALTAALTEIWPHVEVHGADISATAVANARERVPSAKFHVLDAHFVAEHAGEFDFVFSHHVLEHVYDLQGALADLARLTKPTGRMLHALPCGNAGSLAHWLCLQRPDGIEAEQGNRFFFEESSHLRRLQSAELSDALLEQDCELADASYGYHWLGVLRLMTEMTPPAWFAMVDPRRCRERSLPLMLPFLVLLGLVASLRACSHSDLAAAKA
jgi:trans-aconitate methyltransferase